MSKLVSLALISISLAACMGEPAPQDAQAAANLCTVDDPDCTNPVWLYPLCADLGCPYAPSSNPYQWEPCDTQLCYCGSPAVECRQW